LIDVSRFKLGQLLPFPNPAALSRVKPDQPSLIDWANNGDAVLRYQDLSGRAYHPGDRLLPDCFSLYCMARSRFGCGRLDVRGVRGNIRRASAASAERDDNREKQQCMNSS